MHWYNVLLVIASYEGGKLAGQCVAWRVNRRKAMRESKRAYLQQGYKRGWF